MKKLEPRIAVPPIFKMSAEEIVCKYNLEEFRYVLNTMIWSPTLSYNLLRLLDEFERIEAYEWCAVIKTWLDAGEV